ncbi:MAG: repeat-containing protein [Bacteroidota bacterium]|jgi:PKD repeat protein|nr:repeat-containing protein [Bacteroidota bacterium]
MAQVQMQINPLTMQPKKQFAFDKSSFTKDKVAKTSTNINQGWFNYGRATENMLGVTSDLNSNYLFPDSLGYGEFGAGNFAPCWVHHLAELVDFRSVMFSNDVSTNWLANSVAPFAIDSMSILYAYTRNHPNPNIVDTLIFTVFDNTTPGNMMLEHFTGTIAANYGVDTLPFELLGYTSANNIIATPTINTQPQNTPAGQYKFKVLLTMADTAVVMYKEKKFSLPIPFSSNAGKLIVADIMFKPGYAYSLGDHIGTTGNAFYFTSLEENGGGSFMNHIDCSFGSYLCDNSMSYVITQDVRYDNAGAWNFYYTPTIAFTAPYAYEHHQISFHLTDSVSCVANSQFSVVPDTTTLGNYSAYNNSWGTGALTYVWDFGDGNTSTLQYPSHQYAVPGQYIVCLTASSNTGSMTCSDYYCDSSSVQKPAGFLMSQFNVIPQIVTSIKSESDFKINTYPNPIADQLIIETNSNDNKLTYALIDALGRTVLTGNIENSKATLNTSILAKGFYNLSITNKEGRSLKTIKLVK